MCASAAAKGHGPCYRKGGRVRGHAPPEIVQKSTDGGEFW